MYDLIGWNRCVQRWESTLVRLLVHAILILLMLIKFIPIISLLRLFEEKLWSTLNMCLPQKPINNQTSNKMYHFSLKLLKVSIKSKSKTALVG